MKRVGQQHSRFRKSMEMFKNIIVLFRKSVKILKKQKKENNKKKKIIIDIEAKCKLEISRNVTKHKKTHKKKRKK